MKRFVMKNGEVLLQEEIADCPDKSKSLAELEEACKSHVAELEKVMTQLTHTNSENAELTLTNEKYLAEIAELNQRLVAHESQLIDPTDTKNVPPKPPDQTKSK